MYLCIDIARPVVAGSFGNSIINYAAIAQSVIQPGIEKIMHFIDLATYVACIPVAIDA